MKKSKYAALVLASTLALSTVATTAPQAFGGEGITAQAESVAEGDKYISQTTGEDTAKKTTILVEDVMYDVTISGTTATLKDAKNKETKVENGKVAIVNGLNVSVAITTDTVTLTVIAQQTAGSVTNMINDLDITAESYKEDVTAASAAYELLPASDAAKVRNKSLLDVHVTLAADTKFLGEIGELPSLETIEGYTEATKDGDKFKSVTEKGKVRVINEDLESAVTALITFDTAAKAYDKDKKKALDAVIKLVKENLKAAKEQQKIVSGSENLKVFKSAYKALTTGGEFKTSPESIAVKNGKFKIDGDSYVVEEKDGKYVVTGPAGEVTLESDGKSFKFQDKDSTSESAFTKNDTYTISKDSNGFAITKAEETITVPVTGIKLLKLDTKMSVNAYKTLKTGVKKYDDSQIEVIKSASVAYKSLDSTSKKKVTKAQVAKLKKYESALKAQETLEKKLISEDSKGVEKAIKSLAYGKNDYSTETVQKVRDKYDVLTAKYKKKIKKSVVETLENHEAAVEVVDAIQELPKSLLVTATNEAGLKDLTDAIDTIAKEGGSYSKLEPAQQKLVKNYKDIAAINKQIATQKNYYTNATILTAWDEAFKKINGTTNLQVINNQFAVSDAVYTISYDKKSKVTTVADKDGKSVGSQKDADKGVTAPFEIESLKVKVTASKGKVTQVTKLDDSITALEVPDASKSEAYTKEQIALIDTATKAQLAVNAVKDAKPFIHKDDAKVLKTHETALKKQNTADLAAIKKTISDLSYEASDYSTKVTSAKTAYDTFIALYVDETNIKAVEASKKLLDNHTAVSAKKAALDDIPTSITKENVTEVKGKVTAARTAFDALTADQKKLAKGVETKIKTAEAAVKTAETPETPAS